MRRNREVALAMAAMASVAGTGFASGRETVLFFSQLGWAAGPGMFLAAMMFALMTGSVLHFARSAAAADVTGVFGRISKCCGDGMVILYGILMALVSAMMLRTCGELGALALPVKNGCRLGMLMALFLSVAIGTGRMRFLPGLGKVAVLATVVFYGALFLDTRPVHIPMRVETVLKLEGSIYAAVILAILHACLNVSVAAGTVIRFSGGNVCPRRAAVMSGCTMLACLVCAHAAVLRGGEEIFAQPLPTVILAARCGTAGFFLSAGFMYMTSVCTLSACMGELTGQLKPEKWQRNTVAVMLPVILFISFTAYGEGIMGFAYPLLGMLCICFMMRAARRFINVYRRLHTQGRSAAAYEKND